MLQEQAKPPLACTRTLLIDGVGPDADDGGSGSIDAVKIIGSFFTDDASRARRDRQLAP